MLYFEQNDKCLDKIKSSFDYDLRFNLSFSDSNLQYLNKPFCLEKVSDYHKSKYLNCFKISAQIFRIKNLRFGNRAKSDRKACRSKMNDFLDKNLSLTNLSDFGGSNLLALKTLSQSDPELYSANLFSYLGTQTKQDQLFFLKTIYSTFKSLNFLKFIKTKPKNANLKKEPDVDLISLSSYQSLIDNSLNEYDFNLEIYENAPTSLKDDSQFSKNDKFINLEDLKEFKTNDVKNDYNDKGFERINLEPISIDINLTKDKDYNTTDRNVQLVDLKEIKSEPAFYNQFFRLNVLDSLLAKSLSSTSHLESDKSKLEINGQNRDGNSNANSDQNKINQHKTTIQLDSNQPKDEIETIDLNDDVNNFEYYKDSFLGSFDLDIKEQEIINYDFDKKLEKFLKQDLERLNRSKKEANKIEKNERFDSIKCWNQFKSKIPVLKRDKTKFGKTMIDKLRMHYDPLKTRKKSKELIEILNEDYKRNKPDNQSNKDGKEMKSMGPLGSIKSNKTISNIVDNQSKSIQRKSKIPRFMYDEESMKNVNPSDLLINRKEIVLKSKMAKNKGEKLFKLVKEISSPKNTTDKEEYQYLKKCLPRTKSESFINEQLDANRANEDFREQLLDLELKTNGNCLFQLYDYFGDFKEKAKRNQRD